MQTGWLFTTTGLAGTACKVEPRFLAVNVVMHCHLHTGFNIEVQPE